MSEKGTGGDKEELIEDVGRNGTKSTSYGHDNMQNNPPQVLHYMCSFISLNSQV